MFSASREESPWAPIVSWNVNRTSEPGLFAKEIGPVFTAPGEHVLRVPPFFVIKT
jgi:hypothetical protein